MSQTQMGRNSAYDAGSNVEAQSQITRQIIQPIQRRIPSTKNIETILEDFDPKDRHHGTREIRIADIQRYASWNLPKKQNLIDSVLKNIEMGQITAAQNADISGQWVDILDGQTRLTVLHEFKNGKFKLADGAFWNDLSPQEKSQFLTYQITWVEVKKTPSMTLEGYQEICCMQFERLNSGKQLTANEMFHSRFRSPVMQFVLSLKQHERYGPKIRKYICNALGGNEKYTGLSEFAGIVIASITKKTECITTSYTVNGPLVERLISQEDKNESYKFLDLLFDRLERNIPNPRTNVQKSFIKLTEATGMMLFDWITSPIGETHDDMWDAFLKEYHLNSKILIKKLFEKVSESQQRNSYGMGSKLIACINAFTQTGSFDHIISNVVDDESASETEDDN